MQIVKTLERMFTEGLINRREFIARLSALGIAATMSPLLIPKNVEAAVPKKGGHFVMGATGGSTTDSMDPATLTSNMNQNINWQIRNSLVEFDHNFNVIPELAESWDVNTRCQGVDIQTAQGRGIPQWQNHDSRGCDLFHQPPQGRGFQIRCQRIPEKHRRY